MTEPLIPRLINWGLVYRNAWLPSHCASVEWRHIQHRGLTEGEEDTRRRAKVEIDPRDAEVVEKVWRTLTALDQKLLLYVYIWRSKDKQICRRLGISADTVDGCYVYFEIAKARAHRAIGRALDSLHKRVENASAVQNSCDVF